MSLRLCYNLVLYGLFDLYLPSKHALNLLCEYESSSNALGLGNIDAFSIDW